MSQDNSSLGAQTHQTEGDAVMVMSKCKRTALTTFAALSVALLVGGAPEMVHADVGGNTGKSQAEEGTWSVLSGSTLRSTLEGWSNVSGWTLVWDSPYDYRIKASVTFRDDFQNSVGRLVDSIHQANPDLSATIYRGNRVIHITSDALTSD